MKNILLEFIILSFLFCCCSKENDGSIIQPQQKIEGQFLDDFTYEVFPSAKDNFDKAVFRLWIPVDTLRAIVILTPGINNDGTNLIFEEDWQNFSDLEKVALVGVYLRGHGDSEKDYRYAENGSGAALIAAIDSIAKRNNILQLSTLPLLMWGHSAGGSFSYGFSAYMPERVVCFAALKGGTYFSTQGSENRNIPALMIAGEYDVDNLESSKSWFLKKRVEGGIWCFAVEPNSGHRVDRSNKFVIPFFRSAMEKRLPLKPSDSSELLLIPEETGWLGNLENFDIAAYAEYSGDKVKTAWLADENIAKIWQLFVTDRDVTKEKF